MRPDSDDRVTITVGQPKLSCFPIFYLTFEINQISQSVTTLNERPCG